MAGGGGYRGTNDSSSIYAGPGGISYISGHPNCIAIKNETDQSAKVATYSQSSDSYHYSNLIFTETEIKSGNEEMPNPLNSDSEIGHQGNGYAKITIISIDINN